MREGTELELRALFTSSEAQDRIASVHEGSSFEVGSILPADDLGKFTVSV